MLYKFLEFTDEILFKSNMNVPDVVRKSSKYKDRMVNFYLNQPATDFLRNFHKYSEWFKRSEAFKNKLENSVEQYLYEEIPMASSQVDVNVDRFCEAQVKG